MDKRSNDLFEGGCARDIIGLTNINDDTDINIINPSLWNSK